MSTRVGSTSGAKYLARVVNLDKVEEQEYREACERLAAYAAGEMKNEELRMKNGGIFHHHSSFILHPSSDKKEAV